MSVYDVLARRWGERHVEDVRAIYRRTMERHGAAIRYALFAAEDPCLAEDNVPRLAWMEGTRALWMHMLSVAGRSYEPQAPRPGDAIDRLPLDETFLSDLGAEAHFWRTNQAFALPLEFAFHAARLSAFHRVCALARMDPYHLRRPKPADSGE